LKPDNPDTISATNPIEAPAGSSLGDYLDNLSMLSAEDRELLCKMLQALRNQHVMR
jgi:hypothetical protein